MGISPISSEKGASIRSIESTHPVAHRSGESSLCISEELAFEKVFGNGCTIDWNKRFPGPGSQFMQSANDILFPYSAFPVNEDAGLTLGSFLDGL